MEKTNIKDLIFDKFLINEGSETLSIKIEDLFFNDTDAKLFIINTVNDYMDSSEEERNLVSFEEHFIMSSNADPVINKKRKFVITDFVFKMGLPFFIENNISPLEVMRKLETTIVDTLNVDDVKMFIHKHEDMKSFMEYNKVIW